MLVSITIDAQHVELAMITTDRVIYLTSPGLGRWAIVTDPPTPYRDLFAFGVFNTDPGPDALEARKPASLKQLADEPVYYPIGHVHLLDSPEGTDGEAEAEYWIGAKDFIVRKVAIHAELMEEDAGLKLTVEMTLSDLGKPVSIETPSASNEHSARTAETLENGWVRAEIPACLPPTILRRRRVGPPMGVPNA